MLNKKSKIMKTKTENQKMLLNGMNFVLIVTLISFSHGLSAQETGSARTLLNKDVTFSDVFAPEVKLNSIQGDIGTLIGFYGGPIINNTLLIGACGGVNLGHPRVNYGYFGGILQYVIRPEDMVHFSSQLVIAYGTTKDYENPKSGLLDNFWNISGASFFLMEPGINLEVNITNHMILIMGASYRYVSGLNENSEDISHTHVTNKDMSGVNFNIGFKFCRSKKNKNL
jgi:hypothetical protein